MEAVTLEEKLCFQLAAADASFPAIVRLITHPFVFSHPDPVGPIAALTLPRPAAAIAAWTSGGMFAIADASPPPPLRAKPAKSSTSIFLYPAGMPNRVAGCAPSATPVNSIDEPSSPSMRTGNRSFVDTHARVTVPSMLLYSQRTASYPLTDSFLPFTQLELVLPSAQGLVQSTGPAIGTLSGPSPIGICM